MSSSSESDADSILSLPQRPISRVRAANSLLGLKKSKKKEKKKQRKEPPRPSFSVTVAATENDADSDVEVLKPPAKQSKGDYNIKDYTMDDIEITTNSVNKVFGRTIDHCEGADERKYTKLHSIGGRPAAELSREELRHFLVKMKIKNSRKANKKECCDAIAHAKFHPKKPETETKDAKRCSINRKRYMNVIFGDDCRDYLATRGESLSKDELTQGLKTDQKLHEKIVEEYAMKDKYNEDEFPEIGVRGDPSVFGPLTWDKSRKLLNTALSEYEKAEKNWKRSGNHQDMKTSDLVGGDENSDEDAPQEEANKQSNTRSFKDFVTTKGKYLLYMHEFAKLYPDILKKCLGKLPPGAFRESIQEEDEGLKKLTPPKKKRKTVAKLSPADIELAKFNKNFEDKNNAIKRGIFNESAINTNKAIIEFKQSKRKLFNEALKASNANNDEAITSRAMKRRYEEYCDRESNLVLTQADFPDSQQSKFEEMYMIDESIKSAKERLESMEKEFDGSQNKENMN